jgi:hypothetical protein
MSTQCTWRNKVNVAKYEKFASIYFIIALNLHVKYLYRIERHVSQNGNMYGIYVLSVCRFRDKSKQIHTSCHFYTKWHRRH